MTADYDYESFGKLTLDKEITGKVISNSYTYTAREWDAETGWYYYRNRYYAGNFFLSRDPIGLLGGLNSYMYVDANPLRWTDPLGLKTYQCTKPLDALGEKWGPRLFPESKWNPTPTYHQYSCIVDAEGNVTCGGQDRGDKGKGKPSNDILNPSGGQCTQSQPDNNCFEKCLIDQWAKPRPNYGIPVGTDCQEYDDDVNNICERQCKIK